MPEPASANLSVYVRLLDEGVDVFRPVPAVVVNAGLVRLGTPAGYDAEDEVWEFAPGSLVRVEPRLLADGEAPVAVARVEEPR